MATTVAHLQAVLSADTRDFDRAMGKSDSRMKGLAKTAGKAGLAGAVIGLGAAVKIGFSEFMDAQKVTAQTNAVIESTGGIANVTAGELDKLSTALMKKSGVDDELIKSGGNVLLTFTKIRNEVGAGNNIFDQATKATLNMSVALGKDLNSSAIMVGKALNDPIKGMASMSRAGVQFTEEQKETVKALIASGDQMGAQKIILKELETQFGGSAEAAGKTFGGQINIAKETLRNLAGEGIAKLMPKLQELAAWFVDVAVPKIRQFVSYLNETFSPVIRGLVDVFRNAFAAIGRLLEDNKTEIATIVDGVKVVLKGIALVFQEVIFPLLRFYFQEGGPFSIIFGTAIKIIAGVITAIEGIVGAFKAVKNWVQEHWGTVASIIEKSPMVQTFQAMARAVERVVDGIRWLIDHIPDIPKMPDLTPGFSLPGRGSEVGKVSAVSGITAKLWDEIALGQGMGLTLSSGLRPGDPGDHGRGHAIDMSGPASTMATYAMALMGRAGIKDVIYGGLNFWQDNARRIMGWAGNEALRDDHYDHVHASVFDKGWGTLAPGLNLVGNFTGRPEHLVEAGRAGGVTIIVNGDVTGDELIRKVERAFRQQMLLNPGWLTP